MKRKILRLFVLTLITVIGTFVCLVGCMLVKQDDMIYLPRAYSDAERRQFERDGLVALPFTQEEGKQTAYWLAPRSDSAESFVWLVFSGNGGCATDYLSVAQAGPDECGWLFVDYPGYGTCEGRPNPGSIRANAFGAIEALAAHLGETPDELNSHLGAFGHSIGSAAALDTASELGLKRAVLVSPFTSMKDMAANYVTPFFTFLLRHRFDNISTIKKFTEQGGTAHILHGDIDAVIPFSMGQTLAAVGGDSCSFTRVEGAGHNDIIARAEQAIAMALKP